jgi:hypothetical protein
MNNELEGTYIVDRAGMPWRVRGVAIIRPGTKRALANLGPAHYVVTHGWRWMGQMGAEPRTDKFIRKQQITRKEATRLKNLLSRQFSIRWGAKVEMRTGMTDRDKRIPDQYAAREIIKSAK